MTPVDYTVAVPTWMRRDQLRECLGGIVAQEPPPADVIVVGRDEDPDARGVAREFGARFVVVSMPGHLPPIRAAVADATTPLLAIIDDDAVPRPGWAAALLAAMTAGVACVGGAVRVAGPRPARVPRSPGALSWYGRLSGGLEWAEGSIRPVATVMEGNCLWRTDVLRGLTFDPTFEAGESINYGLDLTLQARRDGWAVVLTPEAAVDHAPGVRDVDRQRSEVQRQYLAGRNRTHILFTRFSGWRRYVALAWWWGVGDAHSYGLARFVHAAVRGRRGVLPLARAAFRGRRHAAAARGKACPVYDPPSANL